MIGDGLPAARFVQYLSIMLLLGGTGFRLLISRGNAAELPDPWPQRTIIRLAMIALGSVALAMLASIAAMMGLLPWQVALETIWAIVAETSTGWAFLGRLLLLVGALAAAVVISTSRPRAFVVVVLSALALATLAWSGHAAATQGALGVLHRLNDATHLIAAALWLGAIGGFMMLAAPARHDAIVAGHLLKSIRLFAPVGVVLVAMISITGLINAHLIFGLGNIPAVMLTSYGMTLALKLGLVCVMLVCAATHASMGRRDLPSAGRHSQNTLAPMRLVRRSLATEAMTAIGVVGVVAILGTLSPFG